jgi:hypothetical protein
VWSAEGVQRLIALGLSVVPLQVRVSTRRLEFVQNALAKHTLLYKK